MNVSDIDAASQRTADASVGSQFVQRWSPRAMSGDVVTTAQLNTLFEAARWAPSCFNAQPWRFVVSTCGDAGFSHQLACLVPGNQSWADKAGALVTVLSRNRFEHNDAPALTNSFDAGAAWLSLALQARELGLVVHAMRGFDADALRTTLQVPESFDVEAMIAIGHPGDVDALPEGYREREVPSGRKPLAELVMQDVFQDNGAGEG